MTRSPRRRLPVELWAHVLSFDADEEPWAGVALSRVCAAAREAALESTRAPAAQRHFGRRLLRLGDWARVPTLLARALREDAPGVFRHFDGPRGCASDTRRLTLRMLRADAVDALLGLLSRVSLDHTFVAHHALRERAPRCFARLLPRANQHLLAAVHASRHPDVPVDAELEFACGRDAIAAIRHAARHGTLPPGVAADQLPPRTSAALALEVAVPCAREALLRELCPALDARTRGVCAMHALGARWEDGVCALADVFHPPHLPSLCCWLTAGGVERLLRARPDSALALTDELLLALLRNPDEGALWAALGAAPVVLLLARAALSAARRLSATRADAGRVARWLDGVAATV